MFAPPRALARASSEQFFFARRVYGTRGGYDLVGGALPQARGPSDCCSRRVQSKSERWKEMSAQRFLNTAFGVSNGGLAAWGIASGAAYYFFYLPEKEKADAEVLRAANAERLMKQKNYVEFVKEHEAKQTKAGKGGWFGGWFGGKKQ